MGTRCSTEVLRVQFINGVRAEGLRKKLLGSEDDTLDQLLTKARTFEQVERDVRAARPADLTTGGRTSSDAHFIKQYHGPNRNQLAGNNNRREDHKNTANFGTSQGLKYCYRCGGTNHDHGICWYVNQNCRNCGKLGHKATKCKAPRNYTAQGSGAQSQQSSKPRVLTGKPHNDSNQHQLVEHVNLDNVSGDDTINSLNGTSEPAKNATLVINGEKLSLELDTGSAHTVICERIWKLLGSPRLSNPPQLKAYGGFKLPVRGTAQVSARFKGEEKTLELVVVDGNSPSLLGRTWMQAFSELRKWLNEAPVNSVSVSRPEVDALCKEFSDLFAPGHGKLKGYNAHIYLKPDAQFRYFKPRTVAFAMRSKIEADLERLLNLGVIEPIDIAECGSTPIVPVLKPNGAVRICGDFKVTVNSYADMRGILCHTRRSYESINRRQDLFQGWYGRRLSSNGSGPRVSKIFGDLNTQGSLSIHSTAIWLSRCSSDLPKRNRRRSTRPAWSSRLPRRHSGDWQQRARALGSTSTIVCSASRCRNST